MTTDHLDSHDRTDDGRDEAATTDGTDDRAATRDRNDSNDRHSTDDHAGTDDTENRDRTADGNHIANHSHTESDDADDRDRTENRDRTANSGHADADADDTENRNAGGNHDTTDDDNHDTTADGDGDRAADANSTAGHRHRTAVADGGRDDGPDANGNGNDDARGDEPDAIVTPYAVEGEVDYGKLLQQFGADPLTDAQVARFPEPRHPLLRRGVYYAGRDVDRFLDAVETGGTVSVVTGVGPSGPMHLGHVAPFYFAKYLQDEAGAHVYVPVSDDEKYLLKPDLSMDDVHRYTRENLRELLAVGLDPDRTRFVVDTLDADVVYPQAVRFAKHVTQSTMEATYGEPPNVGASFYPAVQTAHLLLPQLVHGRHPTLVPIAVDQDPHVRVCRDVAGRAEYDVDKPAALLGKFLPTLSGPGKMSTSDDAPAIHLTDDREAVAEKIRTHAYSGGRESVAEHRERGGDPEVDVAFQYLRFLFEPDDEVLADLAARYRSGDLLSGEMKEHAVERIADFLEDHQRRRPEGDLREAVAPFRLTDEERVRLRPEVLG